LADAEDPQRPPVRIGEDPLAGQVRAPATRRVDRLLKAVRPSGLDHLPVLFGNDGEDVGGYQLDVATPDDLVHGEIVGGGGGVDQQVAAAQVFDVNPVGGPVDDGMEQGV